MSLLDLKLGRDLIDAIDAECGQMATSIAAGSCTTMEHYREQVGIIKGMMAARDRCEQMMCKLTGEEAEQSGGGTG